MKLTRKLLFVNGCLMLAVTVYIFPVVRTRGFQPNDMVLVAVGVIAILQMWLSWWLR